MTWSPLLRTHFTNALAEHGERGPVGAVLRELATGDLSDESFESIVTSHGVRREPWFRGQLLDLVLGYIQAVLDAHLRLLREHQAEVARLRRHLSIKDGEFMERRPAEIAAILNGQLERILDDGIIDGEEELRQVELQTAFGIGYDDYLAVSRRAIENAYSELQALAGRNPDATAKLLALEPIYRLATVRPRGLGALY